MDAREVSEVRRGVRQIEDNHPCPVVCGHARALWNALGDAVVPDPESVPSYTKTAIVRATDRLSVSIAAHRAHNA